MTNLQLAFRTLWKTPFVTAVAVLSLALGIGANSAIFSLFDQMLLRPLPVPEPNRLVNLASPGPKMGSTSCNDAGECDEVFSYPMFRDLEREQTAFTGLAAHRAFGANLAFEGRTASGEGMLVSGSYFSTLGVGPALGRLIGPDDELAIGAARVVVLSHGEWQARFGARDDVIGETMIVNGQPLEIIGVTPPGFHGTTLGGAPQVFVPITLRGLMAPGFDGFEDRRSYWVYLFARLEPDVTREQAAAAINRPYRAILAEIDGPLQEGMSEARLEEFVAKTLLVKPGARGQSTIHEESRMPLTLLFAVAGVVLLIACANIANLLLARSAARAGEMSIRLAIGAGRRALVTQLLVESCVLAILGGFAGLAVARGTLHLIAWIFPPDSSTMLDLRLNLPIVLFAAALSLGTGLLFGLFPALYSTRADLATMLRGQSGQPSGARGAARFRTVLVTAQIALSLALLVGAGLFTKSLLNISRIELGLEIENLATFGLSPELSGYSPERSQALFQRTEEALAAVPGVTAVTAAMVPMLANSNWGNSLTVEGFKSDSETDTNARFNAVGPGYFGAVGIPLLAGRPFTAADIQGAPNVAIVNQTFAEKFGFGAEVIGRRFAEGRGDELDIEIIGLVRDAKYSEVKGVVPPLYFRPYRQLEDVGDLTFYVRAAVPPETLLATLPGVVAELDPNLPVENLKTMTQQVRENVYSDRIITTLSAAFGVLATLLAAVGLYGVLAYTVTQRTRELGLRMALGADGGRIRGLVFRQVAKLTVVGGVIGAIAALALGRVARSQLFGLESHDPTVLLASLLVIAGVAFVAGLVPAMRASRIDPMVALRWE